MKARQGALDAVLTVDSIPTLFELFRDVTSALPSRYDSIRVSLGSLSEEENWLWQDSLRRDYRACGCREGALVGVLALAAHLVSAAVGGSFGWTTVGLALPVFFVGGLVGKALGKRRARARLARRIVELRDRVSDQSWPAPKPSADHRCGNP